MTMQKVGTNSFFLDHLVDFLKGYCVFEDIALEAWGLLKNKLALEGIDDNSVVQSKLDRYRSIDVAMSWDSFRRKLVEREVGLAIGKSLRVKQRFMELSRQKRPFSGVCPWESSVMTHIDIGVLCSGTAKCIAGQELKISVGARPFRKLLFEGAKEKEVK